MDLQNLPDKVADYAALVQQKGGTLYLVGGAVRDILLGYAPKDLDFVVTGLTILQMVSLFGDNISGTTAPVWNTLIGEIALARKERRNGKGYNGFEFYTDPSITIVEDLLRRDFTINAMAINILTGELIDPFGGQADIKRGMLRHICSAGFAEDPIRVLRAARFAVRLGFKIHSTTLSLCKEVVGQIKDYAIERVTLEMTKSLEESIFPAFVRALVNMGVVEHIFPLFKDIDIVPAGKGKHAPDESVLNHLEIVCNKMPKDPIMQFVGFMHDIGKVVTPKDEWPSHHDHPKTGEYLIAEFIRQYKLPNAYKVAELVARYHMSYPETKKAGKRIKRFLTIYKHGAWPYFVELVKADRDVDLTNDGIILEDITKKNWGKILIERGFEPGPKMAGMILQEEVTAYKKRRKL